MIKEKNLSKPIESFLFIVKEEDLPIRLDSFLAQKMPWRSRSFFQKMIKKKEIKVNDLDSRAGRYLLENEKIFVDITAYQQKFEKPLNIKLDIIYEDDHLLVLNKPAGVVVHPAGRHLYDTLLNVVHSQYSGSSYLPNLVHRLDRETSGVLVLAKSEQVRVNLARQIEGRKVTKLYKALTHGVFSRREGLIDLPLGKDPYSYIKNKQDVLLNGLPSRTIYKVIATAPVVEGFINGVSWVDIELLTGRTHQIRVHLAASGHPILADKMYGRENCCHYKDINVSSHLLHAWKFGCCHPVTHQEIEFVAKLPAAFTAMVNQVFEGSGN